MTVLTTVDAAPHTFVFPLLIASSCFGQQTHSATDVWRTGIGLDVNRLNETVRDTFLQRAAKATSAFCWPRTVNSHL